MEREISKEEIKHLVIDFLKEQTLCVIATCLGNMPRATTVEFFPVDTTIYILSEGGKKIENIMQNPNVSIAIHAPLIGWQNVRGLQITGIAEIGRNGSSLYKEGLEAFKMRRGVKTATLPDFMNVIKVKPNKIEYLDTTLGNKNVKVKHVLEF